MAQQNQIVKKCENYVRKAKANDKNSDVSEVVEKGEKKMMFRSSRKSKQKGIVMLWGSIGCERISKYKQRNRRKGKERCSNQGATIKNEWVGLQLCQDD